MGKNTNCEENNMDKNSDEMLKSANNSMNNGGQILNINNVNSPNKTESNQIPVQRQRVQFYDQNEKIDGYGGNR